MEQNETILNEQQDVDNQEIEQQEEQKETNGIENKPLGPCDKKTKTEKNYQEKKKMFYACHFFVEQNNFYLKQSREQQVLAYREKNTFEGNENNYVMMEQQNDESRAKENDFLNIYPSLLSE